MLMLSSPTMPSPTLNGLIGGTAQVNGYVTSTVTNTTTTQANVTGLNFTVGASEVWTAEFHLIVNAASASMRFRFTGPASPTSLAATFLGPSIGGNAYVLSETLTAFSTTTASAYVNGGGLLWMKISLCLVNGANAGTVQLQFATSTTATSTVNLGSYMTARRIA